MTDSLTHLLLHHHLIKIIFLQPGLELQSSRGICMQLVPGAPADTKIHRCSRPLYKMVKNNEYSQPSVSTGFTSVDTEGWLWFYVAVGGHIDWKGEKKDRKIV